jgi:hypothetical protein
MSKDPSPGELAHNKTHTIVMVSLSKGELEAVRGWAEAVNRSIPGLIKEIILKEIQYRDYQTDNQDA